MLNLILWSVQGFLALFFVAAGAPKIIGRGLEKWTGFSDMPRPLVIFIGITEARRCRAGTADGDRHHAVADAAGGYRARHHRPDGRGFHIRGDERLNAVDSRRRTSARAPAIYLGTSMDELVLTAIAAARPHAHLSKSATSFSGADGRMSAFASNGREWHAMSGTFEFVR